MKISDLKNYEVKKNDTEKFRFFNRKKPEVPFVTVATQSFLDFAICTILRIIVGVLIFKILIKDVPIEKIQTFAKPEEFQAFVQEYHIISHVLTAFFAVFVLGAFYYLLLIAFTEKGTIGSWIMNTRFRLPNGQRPKFMRVLVWYFVKALYPIFGALFFITFFYRGITIPTLILFCLTAFFSNIPSMIFGTRTFAEIVSSIAIVRSGR